MKLFDIDEFLEIYSAGNLLPYFRKIKEANSKSLKDFKRKVIKHRKKSRKIQALSNLKNYTVHDLLISAINSELRRRSPFFKVYKGLIPLCRWFVLKTGSKEITFTDESELPSFCTGLNIKFFFAPLKMICFKLYNFLVRNWKWSIGTIISILILIPLWRNNTQHIERPYVIFNEKGSILVKGGAMQDLEKIEVESEIIEEGHRFPKLKIIVTPKHHLAYPPLIEPLDPVMFDITNKRGKGNIFIYQLVAGWNSVNPDNEDILLRFRLEVLK